MLNWLGTTILKTLGIVGVVLLLVVGLVVALKLSLAAFPKWQVLIVVGGGIALLLLIFVPKMQVRNLRVHNTQDGHRKVELENEARKTIAQILGGAAVLAGLYITWQQVIVSQEGQITERFTRATEQLGSDKVEIRIGGIYAFQRIAENSEDDFYPIVSILSTFIRENAPREKAQEEYPSKSLYSYPSGLVDPAPPADIEAALRSLIYLSREHDKGISLDLHGANLEGEAFGLVGNSRANYKPAYLYNANLQYASIIGVNMPKADFSDSNLRGANLGNANLSGARFQSAQLNHANIGSVAFAENGIVDLSGANFQNANLYEADLISVDLSGANFRGAQLERAILCSVDLHDAKNLTQKQLNATEDGGDVRLPEGLHAPSLWRETDTMRGTHGYCLH